MMRVGCMSGLGGTTVKSFRTATYFAAIAMAVLWLAPVVSAADEADGADKPTRPIEKIKAAEERRAAQNEKRNGRVSKRRMEMGKAPDGTEAPPLMLWWNEPAIVEGLGLSDEMRTEFDADFEASNSKAVERTALRDAKRRHHEALKTGDWSTAEKQLATWVSVVTQPVDSLGKLKLKVLSQLSEEQRAKVASDYASLLVIKWVPRRRWSAPPKPAPAAAP